MNSKHKNIKFTFETEDSNSFSFLDVKIIRKNKRFVTSIFRKATFSGVYTNYNSFLPETYKIGLVHMLLFQFFKICSSMENFHVIYKFQCSNCSITYYDETESHLKVRAGGYISTSPLTGKRVINNKKSSVKDHCLLSGHVC